jgi:uncharacterized damage-inducible protein DinB
MQGSTTAFPDTYADRPADELIAAYAAGPARLRAALHGLSLAQLRARPRPAKWSILEIAAHVTDSEVVGAGRIRLALAQSGSAFFGYDQDRWISVFAPPDGDEDTLEGALAVLAAVRAWILPLFARAGDAEWQRTAVHPERGVMTVRQLLELYADHVERHVEQILECRRLLGVPLAMPPVLEPRLY